MFKAIWNYFFPRKVIDTPNDDPSRVIYSTTEDDLIIRKVEGNVIYRPIDKLISYVATNGVEIIADKGTLWLLDYNKHKYFNINNLEESYEKTHEELHCLELRAVKKKPSLPNANVLFDTCEELSIDNEDKLREVFTEEYYPVLEKLVALYKDFHQHRIDINHFIDAQGVHHCYSSYLTPNMVELFTMYQAGTLFKLDTEIYDKVNEVKNAMFDYATFFKSDYKNGMEYRKSVTHDESECVVVNVKDIIFNEQCHNLTGYAIIVDRHGKLWRERGLASPDLFYIHGALRDGVLRTGYTCVDPENIVPIDEEAISKLADEIAGPNAHIRTYVVNQLSDDLTFING